MFHEVLFPTAISRGSQGGLERRTDVITLGSGHEERNSRWFDSRRSYNAGYGIRSLDDLQTVIAFFEERRGRLHGFRWRDHSDFKSCAPSDAPSALDQTLGVGNGVAAAFQLIKTYGTTYAPYSRTIAKPMTGSVLVAVAGTLRPPSTYVIDHTSGVVTFAAGEVPANGAEVTAGFVFDVPARFDTDKLEISLSGFRHGAIPSIPIVEIRS